MALSFERQNSNHVHGGGNDFCTEDQSPQRGFIPTAIDLQEGETCAGFEVDETLGNKEEFNGICIEEYSSRSSQVNFNSKFILVHTNSDGGDLLRNKDDEFHQARSCNSCNEKGRAVSNSGSSNYGSVTHPSDHDKDNDVLVPEESSFWQLPFGRQVRYNQGKSIFNKYLYATVGVMKHIWWKQRRHMMMDLIH